MKPGTSRKVVKENAALLMQHGYTRAVAWAKAYEQARKDYTARYPKANWYPDHLATPAEKKRRAAFRQHPLPASRWPDENPVPPSSRARKAVTRKQRGDLARASDLYSRFSGHDAEEIGHIDKPEIPDVLCAIGEIDGIMYSTIRDGRLEKYVHQFKKAAKPLFCVSPDGSALFLIGGDYDFTERGIVDR